MRLLPSDLNIPLRSGCPAEVFFATSALPNWLLSPSATTPPMMGAELFAIVELRIVKFAVEFVYTAPADTVAVFPEIVLPETVTVPPMECTAPPLPAVEFAYRLELLIVTDPFRFEIAPPLAALLPVNAERSTTSVPPSTKTPPPTPEPAAPDSLMFAMRSRPELETRMARDPFAWI